jgi:signal transduction histidine kinase/PAS domain-containing protein
VEGSIQTEQALLEELRILRARVAQLEQAEARRQQAEIERHQMHMREQEVRRELEATQEQCKAHTLDLSFYKQQECSARNTAHRAEEEARALEVIFETITDGLIVYDHSAHIMRINRALRDLLGLASKPDYVTLSFDQRSSCLDIRDEQGQPLPFQHQPVQRLLRGEVLTGEHAVDVTITTLHGRELQLNVNGAPLYDAHGNIVGAVALFHDVTERRKLERHTHDALKALLAMAEVLVQGTDRADTGELQRTSSVSRVVQRLLRLSRRVLGCKRMGIILIEPETELLQPVTVVGSSTEEMQQWQSRLEGTHLSDHFTDPQLLTDLYAGRSIKLDMIRQATSDALHYYLVMPMHLGTQLIGILSLDYGNDIYELSRDEMALAEAVSKLIALVIERERLLQERAEAHANELALLEANRRMDEFLSIASHELRTPLTTINGNIQLARRRLQTLLPAEAISEDSASKIDQIHDLLNRAEHQVRMQNRLVSDLLDVSRIQANRLDLHIEPCDLLAIVRETVADQRALAPARVIRLESPSDPVLFIEADCDRVAQVITNYLTNALKYSAADLPVEVRVSREDSYVRVSVRDEGPGLPPEEQGRLWERFYRVPGISVQSGSEVGLGLGLYICSIIIERHHGQVGVQSVPGQGSTFWFTLPITQIRDES